MKKNLILGVFRVGFFFFVYFLFLKFSHPANIENGKGAGTLSCVGVLRGRFYFFSFIISIISASELISLSDKPSTFRVLIFSLPMR